MNQKIKRGWLYFTPYYEEIRPLLEVPEDLRTEPPTANSPSKISASMKQKKIHEEMI
jgi:hypothetical protein